MGAKASKPAQAATRRFPTRTPGSAIPPTAHQPQPTPRSDGVRRTRPNGAKDEAIHADGRDPDFDLNAMTDPAFSERLRKMGVATPHPTLSNSSTVGPFSAPASSSASSASPSTYTQTSSSLSPPSHSRERPHTTSYHPSPSQNRTLNALEARGHLQERADAEFEDPTKGREFLDAGMLRKMLLLQNRGMEAREIESRLKLKSGVVARLGPKGITIPVEGAALNKQTWGGLTE